ncbi:MAG: L,D-transpeptidase family protein [Sphingomicrobium sp.]
MKWLVAAVLVGGLWFFGLGPLLSAHKPSAPTAQTRLAAQAEVPRSTDDRIFLTASERTKAASLPIYPPDIRSLLNVRKRMRYGEFVWNDRSIPPGPLTIRVNLTSQLLSVYRGGHEIGTAVILYGADEKETPLGEFPILAKMRRHRSATYDANMPFTLRLTNDGISIHGSDVRWGYATHGCIGLPLPFAEKLFDVAVQGDKVAIVAPAKAV